MGSWVSKIDFFACVPVTVSLAIGRRRSSPPPSAQLRRSANFSILSSSPLWPRRLQPLGSWVSKIDFFACCRLLSCWQSDAADRALPPSAQLRRSANFSILSSSPLWPRRLQPLGSWVSKIDFFAFAAGCCLVVLGKKTCTNRTPLSRAIALSSVAPIRQFFHPR